MNSVDLRGRLIMQEMWTELEKIAAAEEASAEAAPLSSDDAEKETEIIGKDEDSVSPVAGVMGTKIVAKETSAHGFPILENVPGHVFRPDLQAFAPDPNIPGWMVEESAQAGQAVQGAYAKGRQDESIMRAKREMSQGIEKQVHRNRMQRMMLLQRAQGGGPPQPGQAPPQRPPQSPPQRPPQQQAPQVARPAAPKAVRPGSVATPKVPPIRRA